jgi:hypothetical protein
MARNWYGNKVIREVDRYTKHSRTSFSKSDEYWEYAKMGVICLMGLAYIYFLFR